MFNTVRFHKKGGGVAFYIKYIFERKLITNISVVLDNILECGAVEINLRK